MTGPTCGDPEVLNRKLKLGATTYNIIGVAPPEFFGTKVGEAPDMWVPLSMVKEVPPNFGGYKDNFSESLLIMGRLKRRVGSLARILLLRRAEKPRIARLFVANPGNVG